MRRKQEIAWFIQSTQKMFQEETRKQQKNKPLIEYLRGQLVACLWITEKIDLGTAYNKIEALTEEVQNAPGTQRR